MASADSVARNTIVAPSLDAPLGGANVVFCATLKLAWNKLQAYLSKGPIRIDREPPTARALAASTSSDDDVDPAAYVACCGAGPAALEACRAAIAEKLGDEGRSDVLPTSLSDDDLLTFALLQKDLLFARPFARVEHGSSFAGRARVRSFGLGHPDGGDWEGRAGQVVVHDYRRPDDFVLELTTTDANERLLVGRVPPAPTLAETVSGVLARAPDPVARWRRLMGSTHLRRDEPLSIPVVSFDTTRSFEDLIGRGVVGTRWIIVEAKQAVRFRLDETGARLKSEAAVQSMRGPQPRTFFVDGPFALVLIRRGRRTPYFAAWIADEALLARADVA